MEVLPVTPEQVVFFASTILIPALIDIVRVGIFALASRLRWYKIANFTASTPFGLGVSMVWCVIFGSLFYVWLGGGSLKLESLGINSLAILGWSQLLFKGIYQKSEFRKILTTIVDKLGPDNNQSGTQTIVEKNTSTETPQSVG